MRGRRFAGEARQDQFTGVILRQTGAGMDSCFPVGVSIPVWVSILKMTTLEPFWLAASSQCPVGSIIKFRGVLPPDGAIPFQVSLPVAASMEKTAILFAST